MHRLKKRIPPPSFGRAYYNIGRNVQESRFFLIFRSDRSIRLLVFFIEQPESGQTPTVMEESILLDHPTISNQLFKNFYQSHESPESHCHYCLTSSCDKFCHRG
jgi:hypothetical protein